MDAALVQRLHAGGRRAVVYTANAPADVARLRAAGVDGIITDEVQRFSEDARRGR
jgi:glycerophosphoryl diester phosphodiesterase